MHFGYEMPRSYKVRLAWSLEIIRKLSCLEMLIYTYGIQKGVGVNVMKWTQLLREFVAVYGRHLN